MLKRDHQQCIIFFGDKQTAFEKEQFYVLKKSSDFLAQPQFARCAEYMRTLIVPDQTHGTHGIIIKTKEEATAYIPYSRHADFVVTNVPDVGIGVATADCLPIILYDQQQQIIAAVHAGWAGTVQGVAAKAVEAMCKYFGAQSHNIVAFFGPSASGKNYEVSADFKEKIAAGFENTLNHIDGKWYFDVPLYNKKVLEQVCVTQINNDNNFCTIADERFCSYRREGKQALRQMTIAVLKNC